MFNVLVSGNPMAWETDQLMRMDAARFKEYSDGSEAASVSLGDRPTLQLLEGIPALLMYEHNADGPNADIVRYGRLGDIRIVGKEVVFRFDEQGRFPRSVVNEFSDRLGLHKFEHGRTHWAVKDGDIPTSMLAKLLSPDVLGPQITPFISYAREDAEIAQRLYRDLSLAGAAPWLDSERLLGGQNWEAAIRDAIRNCTHFLALISKNSVNKRGYVQKELAHALEILDEFPPDQIFVIPARLDSSSPTHDRLRRLQWVDLFPSYDDGLRRIVGSLGTAHTRSEAAKAVGPKTKGDMPDEVRAVIRANAERDYPDDFSTRKYVIETQVQAWRKLEEFSPADIPSDTLKKIFQFAVQQFPEDFSTRLYVIQSQVDAWLQVQKIDVTDIPRETLRTILGKAERDFPDDFSTRLYVIQNEISAWRELYS